MRASAHGARVRERPRRMASHSLGWVSGWARTARVGRIQLPAHACACERSTARASLERPARVEGRPRAHPRATEAWRAGCGVAKGWAQKRAHRGGRARAEEVCTRVKGAILPAPPRRAWEAPLMREVIAPAFWAKKVRRNSTKFRRNRRPYISLRLFLHVPSCLFSLFHLTRR